MSGILRIFLAAILMLASSTCAGSLEWYSTIYDSVADHSSDNCLSSSVNDLTFHCDRAELSLSQGDIYFFAPVHGKLYECLFDGRGILHISPPTAVETFEVSKHVGGNEVDIDFTNLRIIASSDWLTRRFDISALNPASLSGTLKRFLDSSNRFLGFQDWNVYSGILTQFADRPTDYVWIEVVTAKKKRFFVVYEPTATESFSLLKRSADFQGDFAELILSCFPMEYYKDGGSPVYREPVRQIKPIRKEIDVEITESAHLKCAMHLDFTPVTASLGSLYGAIYRKSVIDSVIDWRGERLFASKLDKEPGFYMFFDEIPQPGDTLGISIFYHSDDMISKSLTGDFYIDSQTRWFPVFEPHEPVQFDMFFKRPWQLQLISVGEKIADSISGGEGYSRWVTTFPIPYASFNYGVFDTLTIEEPGIPIVRVYRGKTHTGDLLGSHMKERVGLDVAGSLQFFTSVYGPIDYPEIRVTEIPYPRGQGMPGLLYLGWGTFQDEHRVWDAQFRAHEVAHQWWGNLVLWDNYHDQWMSEAFSEFSGAWYVQHKLGDKEYFQILDEWRKDVTQKGKTKRGGWSDGTEAGPIWLGHRLASSKSQDYDALVYSKGAYVIHMLRCMMRDWEGGSDDAFSDMMKDFVNSFRYKAANTDDFREVVERHIGEPMDWFFDQWVFDVNVPEFDFDWDQRNTNDGFFVDISIKQKRAPDSFKSIIPARIEFDDGSSTVRNLTATGETSEVTIGPFQRNAKHLEFNYYKAVLCR
jgi:hypothetical protein